METQPPRADSGVTDSLRSLLASSMLYAKTRVRLARLEGREAVRTGLAIAAVALLTVISLLIAYACGLVALTLWIAHAWWQGNIGPAAFIVALGHLMAALAGAVWVVYAARGFHAFEATLSEFTEDKQWVHTDQISKT